MPDYGRKTKKLTQALSMARELNLSHSTRDELYDVLLKAGYNWDAKTATWSQDNAWQGSVFEDVHGNPTGRVNLRVMAHPDKMTEIIDVIQEALAENGLYITATSDKTYPNRKGVGVRVYMEGELS